LFELRPFFWKNGKKINIYGDLKTINLLKKRFDFCFKTGGDYPPIVKANIIKKSFSLGQSNEKIYFNALKVKHGPINSLVYIFLKIKKNYAHFNLKESLHVHKYLKPKKTILTNLHYDLDYDYLLKKLPYNVIPAYDGLKLNL